MMSISNDVVSACDSVAASLGYPHLKDEQRSMIINFVTGNGDANWLRKDTMLASLPSIGAYPGFFKRGFHPLIING